MPSNSLTGVVHPSILAVAKRYHLRLAKQPCGEGLVVAVPAGLNLPIVFNLDSLRSTGSEKADDILVGAGAHAQFVFGCVSERSDSERLPSAYTLHVVVEGGGHCGVSFLLAEPRLDELVINVDVQQGGECQLAIANFNQSAAPKISIKTKGSGRVVFAGFHTGERPLTLSLDSEFISGMTVHMTESTHETIQSFSKDELSCASAVFKDVLSYFPWEYATEILVRLEKDEHIKA